MLKQLKAGLRDIISLLQQALGLPHNRTRAQVNAVKDAFDLALIETERVCILSAAFKLPLEQVTRFAAEFDAQVPRDYTVWRDRGASAMSRRDRKTLHCLVRSVEPRVVVETGTGGGSSAIVFLEQIARQGAGQLHSIDLESPYSQYYGALIPDELRPQWTLHLQKSAPVLPGLLARLKPLDVFLHDSEHSVRQMTWEYELAWEALAVGGVLVSHDVTTTSAFGDFAGKHSDQIRASGIVANLGFFVKGA